MCACLLNTDVFLYPSQHLIVLVAWTRSLNLPDFLLGKTWHLASDLMFGCNNISCQVYLCPFGIEAVFVALVIHVCKNLVTSTVLEVFLKSIFFLEEHVKLLYFNRLKTFVHRSNYGFGIFIRIYWCIGYRTFNILEYVRVPGLHYDLRKRAKNQVFCQTV